MVILLQTSKNNPFSLDQNGGIINSNSSATSTTPSRAAAALAGTSSSSSRTTRRSSNRTTATRTTTIKRSRSTDPPAADHDDDEQQKKHKQELHQHGSPPSCSPPPPPRHVPAASTPPPAAADSPPVPNYDPLPPPPDDDPVDTPPSSAEDNRTNYHDHQHQQHDQQETHGDDEKNSKNNKEEDDEEHHQDGDNHGRNDDDDQYDDEEKKDTTITSSTSTEKPNPDNMSKNHGDNFNELKANSTIFIAGNQFADSLQRAHHPFCSTPTGNEKLRQDEFTIEVGINSQLVDRNFSLHCPNSRTKCQKLSSSQFDIGKSIDLSSQDRAREKDTHACNHMKDGLPSTTAESKRINTLRNRNDHAYSFVQSNRRKDEKKTLQPDLLSPIYLKRRNKTSGSLSAAVLLDSHDESSVPEVLTHLSMTETVDIFNRKTGRIINGVPIAQLSSTLRDHAEYEPIYFANNEKQSNKLYQASRTSPGGRVSAEVRPQSPLLNIGKIVLVIKGIHKGTWGRIVSHIPGNWLIIQRCFSFDGNNNLNMVVHSKSVKLSPKYQVPTFQKDDEGNAILAIQNKISATQQIVSHMNGKIEELKRTPSANQSNQEDTEPKRQVAAAEDQLEKYQLVMKMLDMETI